MSFQMLNFRAETRKADKLVLLESPQMIELLSLRMRRIQSEVPYPYVSDLLALESQNELCRVTTVWSYLDLHPLESSSSVTVHH